MTPALISNPVRQAQPMFARTLENAWKNKGLLACVLWPLSLVYGLAVHVRRLLFRHDLLKSGRVRVPTIVVGNIIIGGAGKTPLVIVLVKHLQRHGYKVGVVSRGFGRTGSAYMEVLPDTPAQMVGDEPALIKKITQAPVFVGSRRLEAAEALLSAYPHTQVLVCDDGLQHYALQRDIEIAVFDDRGVGNGWLLPAGPLRESWPSRLKDLDLVLHSGKSPNVGGFSSERRLADHALSPGGEKIPLQELANIPLVALAGIANPEVFFQMLRARGLTLSQTFSLPDHCDFRHFRYKLSIDTPVICTEKDAVKIFHNAEFKHLRLLAVPLELTPSREFLENLDSLVTPLISELTCLDGHKIA